jgi:hypothetical protein
LNSISYQPSVILTMVRSRAGIDYARLLIDSIRSFGGILSEIPIWLFEANPEKVSCKVFESMGIRVTSLDIPRNVKRYLFGDKIFACAFAEKIAEEHLNSLIWIDLDMLILNPPVLYDLGMSFDTAVRPVHIKNVGLPAVSPLDDFWKKVYQTVGVEDITATVDSFVDERHIRAYFNSAAYSINPSKGLFKRWLECFEELISDKEFQAGPCQDELHQIFLHQAILSALIVAMIPADRILILPPEYNYPYNLQRSIPPEKRAKSINKLVSVVFEEKPMDPDKMDEIEINEPLKSWLSMRIKGIK